MASTDHSIACHVTFYNRPARLGYLLETVTSVLDIRGVRVFVHTNDTAGLDTLPASVSVIVHDMAGVDPTLLATKTRKLIYADRDKYDYTMYLEDDMLFSRMNMEYYFKYHDTAKRHGKYVSFLRTELNRNGNTYFTDFCDGEPTAGLTRFRLDDSEFFSFAGNKYCAAWILDREELCRFIDNHPDDFWCRTVHVDVLATVAFGPILSMYGSDDVVYVDDPGVTIRHLPCNYTNGDRCFGSVNTNVILSSSPSPNDLPKGVMPDSAVAKSDTTKASAPKILFVTGAAGLDYQNDLLFHGLVSIGCDVTDSSRLWYLEKSVPLDKRLGLYGHGFSVAGRVPDRPDVHRSQDEIRQRIADHYYDMVIYGSIRRCADYIDLVTESYKRTEIGVVDGEDSQDIAERFLGKGIYFKRELPDVCTSDVLPISFAIPADCFIEKRQEHELDFAKLIPGVGSTYVYTDEGDYYDGYARSFFGVTFKKFGWDCLRHYEIVAAGSLPFFPDFTHCPQRTMHTWPRALQADANTCAYRWMSGDRNESEWSRIACDFAAYGLEHLTTAELARYVLSKIG